MAIQETASAVYMRAEASKRERGCSKTAIKPPGFLGLIQNWQRVDLPVEEIRNLQMWVSPQRSCGTYHIFQALGQSRLGEVADQIEYLHQLDSPQIDEWFESVSPQLGELTRQRKVEPVVIVEPACFIQGNVFDGNHRALSLLQNDRRDNPSEYIAALVGRVPMVSWSLYFIRSMTRVGDIDTKSRLILAAERLRNFNFALSRQLGTIAEV